MDRNGNSRSLLETVKALASQGFSGPDPAELVTGAGRSYTKSHEGQVHSCGRDDEPAADPAA